MVDPQKHSNSIVRRGDNFDIHFVGFSSTPKDSGAWADNEILMYSLSEGAEPNDLSTDSPKRQLMQNSDLAEMQLLTKAHTAKYQQTGLSSLVSHQSEPDMRGSPPSPSLYAGLSVPPGMLPSPMDSVVIHYDPVIDGRDEGSDPDTYVPINAGKTLYLRHEDTTSKTSPQSVRVRFTIMEIDKVTDLQAKSVANLDQVGNYVSTASFAVPYVDLLGKAFTLASFFGKSGLRNYSKPDHVLSRDYCFMLAENVDHSDNGGSERTDTEHQRFGDYLQVSCSCTLLLSWLISFPHSIVLTLFACYCSLILIVLHVQYGYYFFLDKPVEARLYAQIGSSSQRVPLFLKRTDDVSERERTHFPLTGISYLVMRVSRGYTMDTSVSYLKRMREGHRARLENILQVSNAMEILSVIEGKRRLSTRGKRGKK